MPVIASLTPEAKWSQSKDFMHRLATALSQAGSDRSTAALT